MHMGPRRQLTVVFSKKSASIVVYEFILVPCNQLSGQDLNVLSWIKSHVKLMVKNKKAVWGKWDLQAVGHCDCSQGVRIRPTPVLNTIVLIQ